MKKYHKTSRNELFLIKGDETGALKGSKDLVYASQEWLSKEYLDENGKWVVTLTKTKKASALVWDRGAKQYEIEHICGQLGVNLKDLNVLSEVTDPMEVILKMNFI